MSAIENVNRLNNVVGLLKKYGLNPEHVDLLQDKEINPSRDAPYHNTQHLFAVAIHAERLASYYNSIAASNNGKLLLLAGLYHDINHSQGKYGDAINVARAASDMVSLMEVAEPNLTPSDLNTIADLIISTEHPTKSWSNSTINHRIIQDADLLMILEPDKDEWFTGLTEETGTLVNLETTKVFLEHHSWKTQKARTDLFNAGHLKRDW